jgi:hypothetical protein
MNEPANEAVEVRVAADRHWLKWFDGRPLFWIVLILATMVLLQAQFWRQPSGGDYANWDYVAQVIARGGVPYRDAVNNKSPLSAYIGAAAIIATRPFGLRDVLAIRIIFIVLSALTVAFTFLVTRDYFSDARTALLAATIILTLEPFISMNVRGVQPKTPMVLFGLVTLWAIAKERAYTAGVFAMLSALSWQPGLLFLGVAGLAFSQYLRRWRDMKVAQLLIGALIPLGIVLVYFWIAGALTDFYHWNIHFNATVYAPRETRSLSNFIAHISEMLNGAFRDSRVYFYAAAVGLLIAVARELKRGIERGGGYLFDSCRGHAVVIAPVVYFAFCVVDIQGRPDIIPLLPFVAMFAAFAFGFVVNREVNLLTRVWSNANGVVITNAAFVVLFGFVFLINHRVFSERHVFPTLRDQDTEVAEIASHLQPEDKIFVHGSTEILVLSGLSNASKYFFLDRGKDQYLDQIEPGGFSGWLERLKRERPKVVALSRTAAVDRLEELQAWIAQDYDPRIGRIFTYYLRRDRQP